MYVEELFEFMDRKLGPGWKAEIDSTPVKAALEEWVNAKLGDTLRKAIDDLPEEA